MICVQTVGAGSKEIQRDIGIDLYLNLQAQSLLDDFVIINCFGCSSVADKFGLTFSEEFF